MPHLFSSGVGPSVGPLRSEASKIMKIKCRYNSGCPIAGARRSPVAEVNLR